MGLPALSLRTIRTFLRDLDETRVWDASVTSLTTRSSTVACSNLSGRRLSFEAVASGHLDGSAATLKDLEGALGDVGRKVDEIDWSQPVSHELKSSAIDWSAPVATVQKASAIDWSEPISQQEAGAIDWSKPVSKEKAADFDWSEPVSKAEEQKSSNFDWSERVSQQKASDFDWSEPVSKVEQKTSNFDWCEPAGTQKGSDWSVPTSAGHPDAVLSSDGLQNDGHISFGQQVAKPQSSETLRPPSSKVKAVLFHERRGPQPVTFDYSSGFSE
ncbi:hypothetical protein M427DRAFT_47532 [Gonapodya prolifera JEL478]|uniref:Uncharacterized protein n=1 Tax=Gonapodya prolifera (strain JEL478) TaxID=1344416 RepID=A0A139A2Y8_GONPJ|nr:hypothetical protein M427DRAFT_47532 [Gonapodya prolifera JEL478]|eukprot:KXS11121.1 hypothetical protein M427DRAFT_47532 [Gonapodya prolifera JEL478]